MVAATSDVSTTLGGGGGCENVGTLSCCNIFQERYHNVAAKRCKKTSPQHHGNINSFRQRRSALIFTMLWQPFCNTAKSA